MLAGSTSGKYALFCLLTPRRSLVQAWGWLVPTQYGGEIPLGLCGNLDVIVVARVAVATRHAVREREVQRVGGDAAGLKT